MQKERDFGWALLMLKEGYSLFRSGWNGKGMEIRLERAEGLSGLFITFLTADQKIVPWCPSQTDLLAEDWSIR